MSHRQFQSFSHHNPLSLLQVASSPQEDQQPSSSFSSTPTDALEDEETGGTLVVADDDECVSNIRRGLRRLAQLSLEDYDWRMSRFKEDEANRQLERSMARMLGEDASYVRPMDASDTKIGPLGKAEKLAVEWLSQVIDEEGRRAKKIVKTDGELVRPIDAVDVGGTLGPLGVLEKAVVDFLDRIRSSETERVKSGVWRPKDLGESSRGPLGDLESSVVTALRKIQESEMLRLEQSRSRGDIVRPIDVPGPLGTFEMAVADLIRSEQRRAADGQTKKTTIRPKDATVKGPLGELELQAVEAVKQLTEEERERLRSIQRRLEEQRPMTTDKDSIFGVIETILVGILRAPAMLLGVISRVQELLGSEVLGDNDAYFLNDTSRRSESKNRFKDT